MAQPLTGVWGLLYEKPKALKNSHVVEKTALSKDN